LIHAGRPSLGYLDNGTYHEHILASFALEPTPMSEIVADPPRRWCPLLPGTGIEESQ
jgi:hypothetical protein